MLPIASFRFSATTELWIALIIACLTIAIAIIRRIALPTATKWLIGIGEVMLALACGAPAYLGHRSPRIVVMVDTSASTRGATYLDRAQLQRRLDK
jgi:hypothetical protein